MSKIRLNAVRAVPEIEFRFPRIHGRRLLGCAIEQKLFGCNREAYEIFMPPVRHERVAILKNSKRSTAHSLFIRC